VEPLAFDFDGGGGTYSSTDNSWYGLNGGTWTAGSEYPDASYYLDPHHKEKGRIIC
jgi:hypothetical protein